MAGERVSFDNGRGQTLVGRVEMPAHGKPRAFALYAHCFTCGKDMRAAVNICRALAHKGIAVLRFDFTGIGESEGEFADTNFTSRVGDLVAAANFLAREFEAPKIMVGHSLGGTAVLEAAHDVDSVLAICTIAAPANPEHVGRLLGPARATIEREGEARVSLAGRPFIFKRQFLEDICGRDWCGRLHELHKPLLIFHSPMDSTVDVSNAGEIFAHAVHPKSFVTLNEADHLLSRDEDSEYVGVILAAWVRKYLGELGHRPAHSPASEGEVVARIGSEGLRTEVFAGSHALISDEPRSVGGSDAGASPYGLLTAALGACTAMTLRMYAQAKRWPLVGVTVYLRHAKTHAKDCASCADKPARMDVIEREIALEGDLDADQRARLLEIADRCPVHRTLRSEVVIRTHLREDPPHS